ncbi:MAG: terminase small subunit [Phycisphaerae bacterium]
MSKKEESKEKIPQQEGKLTEKQKRFCEEYLVDLDVTEAAIRAGYSKDSIYSIGEELLKKPEIRNYIQELKQHEV